MSSADILVVGGGPSAFGALLALTSRGLRPTILAPQGPWQGPTEDPGSSSKSGLARKTRFGSSEMYRYPVAAGARFDVNGPLPVSAVPGGLSTVWGSNIQVFSGRDLEPWGMSAPDMSASYAEVLSSFLHQGSDDALSKRFPWPRAFPGRQPLSRRVRRALARARSDADSGVLIGLGRNATAPQGQGCIACGRCLDGCPEGVIFDAGPHIDRLVRSHNLTVIDGLATRVEESGGEARVRYINRQTNEECELTAGEVLLGAGSIATTALLMASDLIEGPAHLDDTQVFYVPLLPAAAPDRGPATYSLAQMFATSDASVAGLDFHLSIYESDPSFASRAEGLVGPIARYVPQRAYRQVMAGIGFIPAAHSGRIALEPSSSDAQSRVVVRTMPNPASRSYVDRVLRTAAGPLRRIGMHVLRPLAQVSDVGASYHVGHLRAGGDEPVEVASGRVHGTDVIHVIDGAALPVVPTGPVTLTMMANSHRVALRLGGSTRA